MSVTFFVELAGEPLNQLLERPGIMAGLRQMGAAVSMAVLDLSPSRARAVRRLTEQQISVTGWLVLDEKDGYWLTADNPLQAARRYQELLQWVRKEGLALEAVGLDLEPPFDDAMAVMQEGQKAVTRLLRRRRSRKKLAQAQGIYRGLVEEIRNDGYRVESYQFPLIVDERRANSTLLQRTLGFVDVPVDRDVLMLYETLLPGRLSDAMIDVYGPDSPAIAVGITGGGVPFVLEALGGRTMGFRRLKRALRRARRYTEHLYIFSLEGCVEGGYFQELCRTPLDQPESPSVLTPAGRAMRSSLRALLRGETLIERLF